MSNYYDDLLENDEDYKRQYNGQYNKEIQRKLEELPEDEREDYRKELETIRYAPTNRPIQDVDYNFRRAEDNIRKKRESNKDPYVENFLDFIAKSEGKTKEQVRKKYKKGMGKPGRTGLSKWDV